MKNKKSERNFISFEKEREKIKETKINTFPLNIHIVSTHNEKIYIKKIKEIIPLFKILKKIETNDEILVKKKQESLKNEILISEGVGVFEKDLEIFDKFNVFGGIVGVIIGFVLSFFLFGFASHVMRALITTVGCFLYIPFMIYKKHIRNRLVPIILKKNSTICRIRGEKGGKNWCNFYNFNDIKKDLYYKYLKYGNKITIEILKTNKDLVLLRFNEKFTPERYSKIIFGYLEKKEKFSKGNLKHDNKLANHVCSGKVFHQPDGIYVEKVGKKYDYDTKVYICDTKNTTFIKRYTLVEYFNEKHKKISKKIGIEKFNKEIFDKIFYSKYFE
jgi:hypothetical protein